MISATIAADRRTSSGITVGGTIRCEVCGKAEACELVLQANGNFHLATVAGKYGSGWCWGYRRGDPKGARLVCWCPKHNQDVMSPLQRILARGYCPGSLDLPDPARVDAERRAICGKCGRRIRVFVNPVRFAVHKQRFVARRRGY